MTSEELRLALERVGHALVAVDVPLRMPLAYIHARLRLPCQM